MDLHRSEDEGYYCDVIQKAHLNVLALFALRGPVVLLLLVC